MNPLILHGFLIILCVCAISSLEAIRGELPNGMKYIVEQVSGDRGKISADMHISIGNFDEESGEEGYAHLIEHVLFGDNTIFDFNEFDSYLHSNATKNGISVNANTTVQNTVYKMDLNLLEGASLIKALKFFQAILSNQNFSDKIIQREAKIILEEWRMRNDFHYHWMNHVILKGVFADSLFPENRHELIEKETFAATAESLQKFHAKHYGPKRATLIIVGDIDVNQVVELIKTLFEPLIDRTNPRKQLAIDKRVIVNTAAVVQKDIFQEMSATFGLVDLSGLKNLSDEDLQTRVNRKVVLEILNQLIEEMLLHDKVLSSYELYESEYIENTTLLMIKLTSTDSDWEPLIERSVALLNAMTNLSLMDSEIDSIKIKINNDLSARLKSIKRSRNELCQAYENQLNYETCFKTPMEEISSMQEALKAVTAESVINVARKWISKSKSFLVLCLPENLQSVDNAMLWEKVNHEWGLSPSSLTFRKELKDFANQVLEQELDHINDLKSERAFRWADFYQIEDGTEWYAYGNEHLFALKSHDTIQSDDQLCTLSVYFSLGDRINIGSTQLACCAIQQSLRKLSNAFASSIYSAEAFLLGNNLIFTLNFPKKGKNVVKAMIKYLLYDFKVGSDQLEGLKKNLSGYFIMQNYPLLQIGESYLTEALGYKSRKQIEEEINKTTLKELNNEIRFILGYTPLLSCIYSDSISDNETRKLFRDIFSKRTGHRIDPPTQSDYQSQISTNYHEVTINRPGKEALVMVVYKIPKASKVVKIIVQEFIVSRLEKRIRYDEGLTYSIFSTIQSDYMAFYLVCHLDNAKKVQEEMIEEVNRLAVDKVLTYEEFVGFASRYEAPSWDIIKFVEETEIACQQLAIDGPALKIQVKTIR